MARYVSFAVLLAVTIFVSIAFYKVMAGFLVPLFLAALLVVIFNPIYNWLTSRLAAVRIFPTRRRAQQGAAVATTLLVATLVLVPFAAVVLLAANEARDLATTTNSTTVFDELKKVRVSLGLDVPAADEIRETERLFVLLLENFNPDELEFQRQLLFEIEAATKSVGVHYDLKWAKSPRGPSAQTSNNNETAEPDSDDETSTPSDQDDQNQGPVEWNDFFKQLTQARIHNDQLASQSPDPADFHQYLDQLIDLESQFRILRANVFLGTNGWLKELVNPSKNTLLNYGTSSLKFAQQRMLDFGSASTAFLGRLVIGTAIMMFGFFFFLLDGQAMIESVKGLSPLDDVHEQELLDEFSSVSRAIVLATLLSAITQGLLAGIGYYFVGFQSVFLLTMLTACLALVPFVGAAAVWVPCSLYLYFVDESLAGAIGLSIYGLLVISMADNIIKPLILHGQSNLHPLLAFLSIIGGVGAIGPIGLLVGPMVVAFLQTLLKIFHNEVRSFDDVEAIQRAQDRCRLGRFQREVRPYPERDPAQLRASRSSTPR